MPAPPPPALQTAAIEGSTEEVERLLAEGANIEEKGGEFGWTALHAACSPVIPTGEEALVVQLLLDYNADVSSKDTDGGTPLHATAKWGSEAAAGLLLRYNADVSVQDILGKTPLHYAAHNDDSVLVAGLLLAEGADVSAKDKSGATPLHFAATYGEELMAELLLQNKADVSVQTTTTKSTPLHYAARFNRMLVVDLLLAAGADVSVKDSCRLDVRVRNTPREEAMLHSHHHIAATIEAVEVSRAKDVAFSMGLAERLGAQSCVNALDAEMLRLVLDNV
jgi:serine/threonine-protein phosphatase 6 regulatory ankyrin repeat subunit B